MRVRGVLFDFGNTLFAHASLASTITAAAHGLGHEEMSSAEAAEIAEAIDAAAASAEEAVHRRDLDAAVWAARWAHLYGVADHRWPGLGAAVDASMHDPAQWIPFRDAADVLAALHDAGIAVGVVSNTGWDVRGPFAARGLDGLVDNFTMSCEVRVAKPDRAIFAIACARLGVEPAAVLMVGDDATADTGAAALGMRTLLLPPVGLGGDNGLDVVCDLAGLPARAGSAPAGGSAR